MNLPTFLTLPNALTVSLILVLIGAFGVLRRRNLILVLLSVEIMLNGVNLSLISFNYFLWGASEQGHYLYMLSIGVAAVEAAVGLAMVIVLFRNHRDVTRGRIARLGEHGADAAPSAVASAEVKS
jgi:NADH-quinone oxidoreductase subunit K